MKIKLLFLILASCFLACKNDLIKEEEQQKELTQGQILIRQDLYDFIKSRTYILSPDTTPAKHIHIEFVMTSKNDTIFLVSSYYANYFANENDEYRGYIDIGEFKLFIFDKDNIANQYYDSTSLITSPIAIEKIHDIFLVTTGIVKDDTFFEIHDTFFDENITNLFKCYNRPPIR